MVVIFNGDADIAENTDATRTAIPIFGDHPGQDGRMKITRDVMSVGFLYNIQRININKSSYSK